MAICIKEPEKEPDIQHTDTDIKGVGQKGERDRKIERVTDIHISQRERERERERDREIERGWEGGREE